MCVMVATSKVQLHEFHDGYNHASLRLSRYAYYTVMYTACHNLMSNCPSFIDPHAICSLASQTASSPPFVQTDVVGQGGRVWRNLVAHYMQLLWKK